MATDDDMKRSRAAKPIYRKVGHSGAASEQHDADERRAAPEGDRAEERAAVAAERGKRPSAERPEGVRSAGGGTRMAAPGEEPKAEAPKGAHVQRGPEMKRAQGRMVPAGTAADEAGVPQAEGGFRGKRLVGALAALAVAIVAVGRGGCGVMSSNGSGDGIVVDGEVLEVNDLASDGQLVNPIDWEAWTARNSDVYAWLVVPDTKVDLPILQHPLIDDYYLTHNIDGEPLIDGALYTQLNYNSKDLTSDKVTVVYGHTFEEKDTMFSTLHELEDPTFFEEHPVFYVYTPTQRLEYEVVSAFDSDNKHILEARDMDDPAVVDEFFAMVQNPTTMNGNTRALEKPLSAADDHLLILSTCTKPANDNARYLVVAVLRGVQQTEDRQVEMIDPNLEIETISGPME